MFAKLTLLVILGCSLVLASPIHAIEHRIIQRSVLGTVGDWLHKTDAAIDNVLNRVKHPFQTLYNTAIGTGNAVGSSVEMVQKVITTYDDIKSTSANSMNMIKNSFLGRVISEMQNMVNNLTKPSDAKTIEQLKQKNKEIAETSEKNMKLLQQQLQEAINAERDRLEISLYRWETEANNILKPKSG